MLITLEQGKAHLGIEHEEQDEMLEEMLIEASGIVLDYLKKDVDEWQATAGDPDGVPAPVSAAVKLVLGALYENREGHDAAQMPQPLSTTVKSLLDRQRDPTLA